MGGGRVQMWGERERVVVPRTHPGVHLGHVTGAPMRRSGKKAMLFCVPKSFTIWLVPTDQNQDVVYRPQICSWEQRLPPMLLPPGLPAYLAVQAQKDEHHEEQGGPEWGEGHHGDGLWVGNKGQARAWRGSREKGAEWNSVPHSITTFI